MINQIYESATNKKIKALTFPDSPQVSIGIHGVNEIEPYLERGSEGYVTWFIVWIATDGEKTEWKRVNSNFVSQVFYL
jgi:hypothetical protein